MYLVYKRVRGIEKKIQRYDSVATLQTETKKDEHRRKRIVKRVAKL